MIEKYFHYSDTDTCRLCKYMYYDMQQGVMCRKHSQQTNAAWSCDDFKIEW